ncbi:hypothetical protein [Amycolatopsis sp. lyj-109]|uniref:hypothetical protein n=1 Tax=Amycolatopsis sp. lyj-109 TaxID=2789287 RepID=UPI00397D4780
MLAVRLYLTIGGEWSVDNGDVTHQVEYREDDDTVVEVGWAIEPNTELTLDRGLGNPCGTRFLPVADGGTDPTLD